MPIRFKCPHCQKGLVVKEDLAGKKAACPACKKALTVPAPMSQPADVEALAAAALADPPPSAKAAEPAAPQFVEFTCPFCAEALKLSAELAGKQAPCPECKHILKVPRLKVERPRDWREVQASGPSLAVGSQLQKLEGAWGTATDKGKVSTAALEEADALLIEEPEEAGPGRWIRRGVWGTAIAGVIVLAWWGLNRQKINEQQKNALAQALEIVAAKDDKVAKISPAWRGIIHRGAGEFYTVKKEPQKAREHFLKARTAFLRGPNDAPSVDGDLFLAQLAFALVELGGTPQEVDNKERLDWNNDVFKGIRVVLEGIGADEARLWAIRELSFRLAKKKQLPLAETLAGQFAKSEKQALEYARDAKKTPNKAAQPEDLIARMGDAAGLARQGKTDEAMKLVRADGGPAVHQVQAAIAVAAVLQAEANPQAAGIVKDAVDQAAKVKPPPWVVLHLVKVAVRSKVEVKDLIKGLPADFKNWAQLDLFLAELAAATERVSENKIEEIGAAKSLPRALAWEALARHNSRLGYQSAVRDAADQQEEPPIRALMYMGVALGVQDRDR